MVKCPKCGAEVQSPMKKWRQKKRVVIGYFECYRCKTRFRRAIESVNAYEEFMKNNPAVEEWLDLRPKNTRKQYAVQLQKFCEFAKITPEQFQKLPNKKARDVAWSYIKTLLKGKKSSLASIGMYALKSFYRNHDGETLSFDSKRGGKHYLNNLRRKRVAYEHVPKRKEVYRIANMATSLRDRAIVLVLFHGGMRVNALCSLNYGHVKRQLTRRKIPIRLRITDEIDTKLQGTKDVDTVIFDGVITQRLVDIAAEKKVKNLVAALLSETIKQPLQINLLTFAEI